MSDDNGTLFGGGGEKRGKILPFRTGGERRPPSGVHQHGHADRPIEGIECVEQFRADDHRAGIHCGQGVAQHRAGAAWRSRRRGRGRPG